MNVSRTSAVELRRRLDVAIDRAVAALEAHQRPDGTWNGVADHEPRTTATWTVAMHWMGALRPDEAEGAARALRRRQRPDGAFPSFPDAAFGHFSTTGLALAAFRAAGVPDADPDVARARRWLDAHGGVPRLTALLADEGDLASVFAAMAGLVDAEALPRPPIATPLVPGVVPLLERRVNAGTIMVSMQLAWVLRALRKGHTRPSRLPWRRAAADAARRYLHVFQNANGNWNSSVTQTSLAAASLVAMGVDRGADDVARAIAWLRAAARPTPDGLEVTEFTTETWSTGLAVQALLACGARPSQPAIVRGVEALLALQHHTPIPAVDQPDREAARGGWSFEPDNETMADTDDTATAVLALVQARRRVDGEALPDPLVDRVDRSVELGLGFLLGMQARSGGFPTFVYGLPDAPPGPAFHRPVPFPAGLLDQLRLLIDPPPELGDPPATALTGRILSTLGARGFGMDSEEVRRAVDYLRDHRAANGVWWGRWLTNYVAATSFVLRGLAAVGADLTAPWVRAAVAWLLQAQNEDGGWGETCDSYLTLDRAGVGPSMPGLTGLAVAALVDVGLADEPAVVRGVRFLLDRQRDDGLWDIDGWTQVFYPPFDLYTLDLESWVRPLEALGVYRCARCGPPGQDALEVLARPLPALDDLRLDGPLPREALRALRGHGDPDTDALIREVFEAGQAEVVRELMGALVRSDEPLPAGLPPRVRDWFGDTAALPPHDANLLRHAGQVFLDDGWRIAMALFVSSLPQAYAAADGARVLMQTRGMTGHAYRRILETAQFIFDVAEPGAFGPSGRGVRAVQKVRLMHAALRHLILVRGTWDVDAWGVPINQEDLAGTLQTFSSVVVDTLPRLGGHLSPEDAAAWMELWGVVGHLLGIHPRLIPADLAQGQRLMQAIRDDQWAASPHGEALVKALVDTMVPWCPPGMKHLPHLLIRHATPAPCADLLDLPPTSRLEEVALDVFAALGQRTDALVDPLRVFDRLSLALEKALVSVQREGKQAQFRIPTSLVRTLEGAAALGLDGVPGGAPLPAGPVATPDAG